MRLVLFLLLISIFQTIASAGYSQNVKITLKSEALSLVDVLRRIEDQSEYRFIYDKSQIDLDKKVKVNFDEASVKNVLEDLFVSQGVSYQMIGSQIILTSSASVSLQQSKNVSGGVADSSGAPLPGVTIVVKGTTKGTITDMEGKYTLLNVPGNATLIFSFVGMKNQEIPVAGKAEINIVLEEDAIGIEEVVAVGYGTQKKINITGAVDVVSSEQLANRPASTVGGLLQGTSPNLNISISNMGGQPGASQNLNIRGIGTISGNGTPLILVDGVEMSMNNLNSDDIESVSILKDAAAAAIYGSRASFGVILISTKKGGKNKKIQVNYSNNLIFSNPIGLPHFVDALTWVTAFSEACSNGNLAQRYSDEQIERIKGYMNGTYPHEYNYENPPNNILTSRWEGNANYDWPALYYTKNAFSQKHNVNIRGGNEKTQYYVSANYFDQNGAYSWGNDSYKRYNVMSNISSQINNWLRFDFSTKYARMVTDYPLGQAGNAETRVWTTLRQFGPMQPYYNEDGTINNPLVAYFKGTGRDIQKSNDSWITLGAELEPVKGWKTKVTYNYNYQNYSQTKNKIPVYVNAANGTVGNIGYSKSGYETTLSQTSYSLANVVSSYEKVIGDHYFKVLVGYEQEDNFYRDLFGSRNGLITDAVPSLSTTTDLASTTLDDRISHWANQGLFGRINYNYKEKYLIEFDGRYNGSSRFAPESRWGFFPSASIGYNISKENFWTTVEPYVNTFKMRASYGALGNQNVANYLYLSNLPVSSNLSYIINGTRPIYAEIPGIISSDLTWETVTTLDFGLDAGFLKNRLNFVFDWYNRTTSDMIGPAEELPAVLGTSAPKSNNAKLSTKGYELTLSWKDRISSDFSYDVRLILGDNKTTVLEYKNDNKLIDTYYPGKELGEIWGYTTDKIMQNEDDVNAMSKQSKFYTKWGIGDIAYKDMNGDGIINDGQRTLDNHGDISKIANANPRYNIGISVGCDLKAFDFSMFWQGIGKRDFVPNLQSQMFWGFVPGGSVGSESALFRNGWMMDYWRPADETNILGPNTDSYFPKPSFVKQDMDKNHQIQTRYIVSAAFLRLKNIQIGYTVPQRISKKLFLQKARIYFSGENLLTIKKLPEIIDPEISEEVSGTATYYPLSSSFSFGVNLTF